MIIGITGFKGSGKSTLAKVLVSMGFTEGSFAAPMKAFVKDVLDLDDSLVYGPSEFRELTIPGMAVTTRHALQTLGTEWGRNTIHPDIWVNYALRKVRGNTVFQDVRFPNEADAIRRVGGIIIRTEREETNLPEWRTWLGRLTGGRLGVHASEAYVPEIVAETWNGDVMGKPTTWTVRGYLESRGQRLP